MFFRSLIFSITFMFLISGCACLSTIPLGYNPEGGSGIGSAHAVKVSVIDERSYVKSGAKRPTYIGHFRTEFGQPYDIFNAKRVELAKQFEADILKELNALGINTSDSAAEFKIRVDILEYNFDAYTNGKFWYEIKIAVLDANDKILADSLLKDERVIAGNYWTGPLVAFRRELPKLYQGIIKKLIRENSIIINALK
jgi:hypothetical protein